MHQPLIQPPQISVWKGQSVCVEAPHQPVNSLKGEERVRSATRVWCYFETLFRVNKSAQLNSTWWFADERKSIGKLCLCLISICRFQWSLGWNVIQYVVFHTWTFIEFLGPDLRNKPFFMFFNHFLDMYIWVNMYFLPLSWEKYPS